MSNQEELYKEIAALIRDNVEDLTDKSLLLFFETYQDVSFPALDEAEMRSWVGEELDIIARTFEENDPSLQDYAMFQGYIVPSSCTSVYSIGNFIESRFHFARLMLSYIVSARIFEMNRVRLLAEAYEDMTLRVLRENVDRYMQAEFARGSMMKYARTYRLDAEGKPAGVPGMVEGREVRASLYPNSDTVAPNVGALTDRERDVASLIAEGLTNKEIAVKCNISALTVKNHISHILAKLHLGNRTELAVWATHHL